MQKELSKNLPSPGRKGRRGEGILKFRMNSFNNASLRGE
jgi:hypothetical protein